MAQNNPQLEDGIQSQFGTGYQPNYDTPYWFEDFDRNQDGTIDSLDLTSWVQAGRPEIAQQVQSFLMNNSYPPNAPNGMNVASDPVYFEDFDLNNDGYLNIQDAQLWGQQGRPDIAAQITNFMTSGAWPEHTPGINPAPGSNPSPSPPDIAFDASHPLDFDGDGVVTMFDAIAGGQQYGQVVAQMVQREILGQNTYDINGDGIVNLDDIMTAQQAGLPEAIVQAMVSQVMNTEPTTEEWNPNASVGQDGSGYHPLDFNQDGIVNILDMVYLQGNSSFSTTTKQILSNMITKYMADTNPYDINGDGVVNVLDISMATQNNLPSSIIQDMMDNLGTSAPIPDIPQTQPSVDPGPWQHEYNLWVEPGNYSLLNGTPYYGPVHRHYNNIGEVFMTEQRHKPHSRILVKVTAQPEQPLIETPGAQPNLPLEQPTPDLSSMPQLGNFGNMDLGLNLDLGNLLGGGFNFNTGQLSENTSGNTENQTGGAPSNDNNTNQQNQGGGQGGGGGGTY